MAPELTRRQVAGGAATLAALLVTRAARLVPARAAAAPADPARELMRRVLRDSRAEDEVVAVGMQLIDASGRVRRRTATFYAKKRTSENSVRLIRFHSPPEFARAGILTIERSGGDADQWIYLPAYHTSRRVPSANRGDTWMGTDFTYEDLTDAKIEQYAYRSLRREAVAGVACAVIEAIPTEPKLIEESAYSRAVFWVDPDESVILKVEYHDRAGRHFKTLSNSALRRFGVYRRWERAEMHDVVRNHRTVAEFGGRKLDQRLGDEYFEVSYLERAR